jgi:hypothetical protein
MVVKLATLLEDWLQERHHKLQRMPQTHACGHFIDEIPTRNLFLLKSNQAPVLPEQADPLT